MIQLGFPLVDQNSHSRHCSIELHCFSALANGFRCPCFLALLLPARTARSICSRISTGIALKHIKKQPYCKVIRFSYRFYGLPIHLLRKTFQS